MSIEATAIEFVAATKKRAQARSHLSALRKKWLDETGEFFDKDESRGGEEEPYEEMMAAIKGREDANAEYRRAKSRLFRACASGVPACPDAQYYRFRTWAEEEGRDIANSFDTERSRWVFFNPMTADLWAAWQAAAGVAPSDGGQR